MMIIPRLYTLCFILYKLAINILLIPWFFYKHPPLFVDHYLRGFIDGVINMQLSFARRIPSIDLQQLQSLLDGPPPNLHLKFENRYGNINFLESIVIAYIIQSLQPKTLFEIGTFDGFSTYHLAKNAPPDAMIYTLNLPVEHSLEDYSKVYSLLEYHGDNQAHESLKTCGIGTLYRKSDVAHKVTQLFGDSLHFDFSPYFGRIHFCFIDGGHSYQHLQKDTATALQLLADWGVIIWHDYNIQHRDIYRFLNELSRHYPLCHIQQSRLVMFVKKKVRK